MKRSFILTALFAMLLFGNEAPVRSAIPFTYASQEAPQLNRVKEAFRDAAARTAGIRSGQIFALPAKYNLIDNPRPHMAFCHVQGKIVKMLGSSPGTSWGYDTHIPLIFWGPGFIRSGVQTETAATLQDLVPTEARLMGASLPEDAQGQVLAEALLPTNRHPKVILTVVFSQVGMDYLQAHPGLTPTIDRLMHDGTDFRNAKVSDLDAETTTGHLAIGTGAYPAQFGITSAMLWMPALGGLRYACHGERYHSPIFIESPTLADVWLHQTHNKALVAGYGSRDRAVIGMIGHGSLYSGNKKPKAVFYDIHKGWLITNPDFYALPAYLQGTSPASYLSALTHGTGVWMGHAIDAKNTVRATPAYATFDGDNVLQMIHLEPFGQSGVTDLLDVSFVSTDAAGHAFGYESDEAGAVLHEEDRQLARIVSTMAAKVGRENLVVILTADNGSAPLPELSGGIRLPEKQLVSDLNNMAGAPVFVRASATQLYLDEAVRRRYHLSFQQLKQMVLDFRVDGKRFFADAITREGALERAKKFMLP